MLTSHVVAVTLKSRDFFIKFYFNSYKILIFTIPTLSLKNCRVKTKKHKHILITFFSTYRCISHGPPISLTLLPFLFPLLLSSLTSSPCQHHPHCHFSRRHHPHFHGDHHSMCLCCTTSSPFFTFRAPNTKLSLINSYANCM